MNTQNKTVKKLSYQLIESIIFTFIGVGIYFIPVFSNQVSEVIVWDKVILSWIKITSFLLLFIINLYLLIPYFLHKKQYTRYILTTIIITLLILFIFQQIKSNFQGNEITGMPPMEIGPGMPPMEFSKDMPPPAGFKLQQKTIKPSAEVELLWNFIIAILVIGNGAAYKVIFWWIKEEKERKLLEDVLRTGNLDVDEYIFVKADYKMIKIKTSEILYIESANEYIKIFLDQEEVITTFMRLKNIESTLPEGKFMRVQRSFIVNLERIKAVEKNRIFIDPKISIPIGQQYKENFQEYLGKNFIQ